MTKTYQIKINQGKDAKALDVPQAGLKSQPVTVSAVAGARYQLIDPETGFAPENIRATRQSNDLKVSFEGSKTTDLVIEDYYKVSPEGYNGLIGETESGKFYEYIPESASGMASVPMLADSGQLVGMALGGMEVAPAGAAVGVLAAGLISPWMLGAGAVAAAAAGGGGGRDASSPEPRKPNGGNALGLKVDLDSNTDGVINGSEKGLVSTTSLTATSDRSKVVVGDKVTFSDGNKIEVVELTAIEIAAGKVISSATWSLPAEDASKTFTAVIASSSGISTPQVEQSIKLDAITESLKTALTIHPITGDNILSADEQKNTTVTVTGKVSGAFAAGDVVTLSVNGQPYKGKAEIDGSYSINIPVKDLQIDADWMLEGTVTGSNGGQFSTAAQSYSIENSTNTGKTTTLFIDPVTMDNLLSFKEIELPSINITGHVNGQFKEGDIVSLLVNGSISNSTVDVSGAYSIVVSTKDLKADGDTTVDAFVSGTGGTSAKAMQNYAIDIQVPVLQDLTIDLDTSNKDSAISGGDGWINKTEMGMSTVTSLTARFDKNTVSVGDKVTFSDGTMTRSVVLDQIMIDEGVVTSEGWKLPAENSKLNVAAVIEDSAGNRSATFNDAATVDTKAMTFQSAPVLDGVSGTVFTSVTFKPDLLTGLLEKGTYTLHVGDKTFNLSQGLTAPGNNKVYLQEVLSIPGNKIFLECWDDAGNHSTSGLLSPQDGTTWQLGTQTQFIV